MPTVNYGQVKGPKGDTGATGNGIVSVTLLSGDHSAGTLDTYRITFADATTFDFEVYNGADSEGGDLISSDNSALELTPTGTVITRNVDDEATLLTINQIDGNGLIMDIQAGGVTKAYITNSGSIATNGSFHASSGNGLSNGGDPDASTIAPTITGAVITRDVADANTAMTVNQANAASTGNIADFQFAGASKASIDKDGNLTAPNVLTWWRSAVTYNAGDLAIAPDGGLWQSLADNNINHSPAWGDTYWGWPPYYAQSIGTPGQVLSKTGASWDSYGWRDLVASLTFVIDGGGSAITTGIKGDIVVPFACTIQSATLLADQSGSIVVNVWKDTYASFPPTVADKITASAPPTLSTATRAQDTTLTGWTKTIAAGDILRFNVDSAATVTRVTLALKVVRT